MDFGRSNRFGPHNPLVVAVLFDDYTHYPANADAVAAHNWVMFLVFIINIAHIKSFGKLLS